MNIGRVISKGYEEPREGTITFMEKILKYLHGLGVLIWTPAQYSCTISSSNCSGAFNQTLKSASVCCRAEKSVCLETVIA